jgi:RHS repeat-associated protein
VEGSATLLADEWTHVAAVRSTNTVKLLVDRNEDASESYSSTLHDNDASLLIGANADGSYFDGMIDEVRIATADKSATLGKADVEYVYNARNQLVTETCGLNVRTYSYDKNGNVTKIEEAVDSTVILTEEMTYDKLNRMLRHEGPSGVEVFAYRGAEWHRFSKATAAGSKAFLYDGDNVVADLSSGVDALYVTPFLDQNLSITKDSATYYYSQDGLGSVRTLTDSSGTVKNSYDYLPFGGAHQPGTNVTVEQRYAYTGRELNAASDLMYYRYRHYDPRVGRFGGRDPVNSHQYRYTGQAPVRRVDPLGLAWTVWRQEHHERAPAFPEVGDTYRDLATQLKLEPSEWFLWLRYTSGLVMCPWDVDEEITELQRLCCKWDVPNTVYVDMGDSMWWNYYLLVAHPRSMGSRFLNIAYAISEQKRKAGYHVCYEEGVSDEEIMAHMRDEDLAEYYFFGHGFRSIINTSGPDSGVSAARYTHHRIALMALYACESLQESNVTAGGFVGGQIGGGRQGQILWRMNVSSAGSLQGYIGCYSGLNDNIDPATVPGGLVPGPIIEDHYDSRR